MSYIPFQDPDPTLENLKSILCDLLVLDPSDISPATEFADLGMDSLDHARLISACEDAFGIDLPQEAHATQTVDGLYQIISLID